MGRQAERLAGWIEGLQSTMFDDILWRGHDENAAAALNVQSRNPTFTLSGQR